MNPIKSFYCRYGVNNYSVLLWFEQYQCYYESPYRYTYQQARAEVARANRRHA